MRVKTHKIFNKKGLKIKRRKLRNNLTPAEATLWKFLSKKQLGWKFRRQQSIGSYIVDFYCPEERLVIELDGAVHGELGQGNYDEKRADYLKSLGIRVIRFENKAVFEDVDWVLGRIRGCFQALGETTPPPTASTLLLAGAAANIP